MRSLGALILAALATLAVGCGSSGGGPPVATSGWTIGALQAVVSVRLLDANPRPGTPAEAEVRVWTPEPVTDVSLDVTLHRQGDEPHSLDTLTVAVLAPDDTLTVRVPVTFGTGQYTIRAAIEGLPAEAEAREGVAASLHALVYPGESFVSGRSLFHARRDSLDAKRGIIGRFLGIGDDALSTVEIETTDGTD